MTLLTNTSTVSYLGNGITASFDFAFKVPAGALTITLTAADGRESVPAPGSFTVTGYDSVTGGSVTFATAPAAGVVVTLARAVDLLQEVALTTGSAFYAEVIEASLDKLAMVDQQQQAALARTVKVPVGSDDTPEDLWATFQDWHRQTGANAAAAAISASNAADSAAEAVHQASSATDQAALATAAGTSATTSAAAAAASADLATSQASAAEGSALTAQAQATLATTSAAAAAASESTATTAATSAQAARDATLAAYDQFDDRYLGAKATAPTVDNDGNPLLAGTLYFDSTLNTMRLWTGAEWVAAYVSGEGVLRVVNNLSDLPNKATARANLGLATVASSGTYDDLSGKPTLGEAAALSVAQINASAVTSGQVIQRVRSVNSAFLSSGASIPADDTIPQITEGVEILTATITPKSSSSILKFTACIHAAPPSTSYYMIVALHKSGVSDALAVSSVVEQPYPTVIYLTHEMTAATTSSTTFSIRVGSTGATFGINGGRFARLYGGALASSFLVEEIHA